MEMVQQMARSTRRSLSDSSSDALRTGGPGMGTIVLRGFRRASPGAIFVALVCIVISFVALVAHSQ